MNNEYDELFDKAKDLIDEMDNNIYDESVTDAFKINFFIQNAERIKEITHKLSTIMKNFPENGYCSIKARNLLNEFECVARVFRELISIDDDISEEDVKVMVTEDTIEEASKDNIVTQAINSIKDCASDNVMDNYYAIKIGGHIDLIRPSNKSELNSLLNNLEVDKPDDIEVYKVSFNKLNTNVRIKKTIEVI